MRRLWLLLLLAACESGAIEPQVEPAEPAPEPSTVRTVPEPAATPAPTPEPAPAPPPNAEPPRSDVTVRTWVVGEALAEDGSTRERHDQAVAIELTSEGWPGEAMEPTLEVQGRRFVHYTHPSPVALRFVVADPSLVPAGETAVLRWGERVVAELTLPTVETP